MDMIGQLYDLKDLVGEPERYLGVNLKKWMLPDGREVWSANGKEYIKNALPLVRNMAEAHDSKLPGGKQAERPVLKLYKPELDTTANWWWGFGIPAMHWNLTMGGRTWADWYSS
jgi:hypothetical protein